MRHRHDEISQCNGRLTRLRRWVGAHLGQTRHERRVMRVAVRLFDLTAPIHGLSKRERLLLKLAALVHDVGRCRGARRHHLHGERMLRKARELPLNSRQRRALRYLTLFHRGQVPAVGEDGILRPGDGRKRLRIVLAILRAADTLDNRRHGAPVALAMRLHASPRRLHVRCHIDGDVNKARKAYLRPKKFKLLSQTMSIRATVDVQPHHALLAA
jgi:exopolyphosphatase/guanosine-5'-triphosphate,3'-diphosphate pyrophosphatase